LGDTRSEIARAGPDVALHFLLTQKDPFMNRLLAWGKSATAWVADEAKRHWKTAVSIAAGAVVAMAVTAIIIGSAGTATPAVLAAAGVSGALGSGTTQTVDDLLNGHKLGVDVVESALVGGAVSAATAGVGRAVAPLLPETVARFLPGSFPELVDESGERSGALVVKAAVRGNIPWGSIPRLIFQQPLPVLISRVEMGLVGAISGETAKRHFSTPAPVTTPAPRSAPTKTESKTSLLDRPLGE
jgi:hypothetical protein